MTALGSVPLATGTTANSITFAWTSPALRDFCARFGIRHVLCAAAPDALSGLEHRFCCCRGPGKRAFSDPEHRLIRFLAPHLIEARRANLVAYFAACRDEAFRSGLCDRMGLIHHAEPGFPELLRREWPQLRTAHVPASLLAALPGHDAVFEGAAIVIKAKRLGDLVHLQAGRQGRLRRLSPRERLITKPLVCAPPTRRSDKRSASRPRLSRSTPTRSTRKPACGARRSSRSSSRNAITVGPGESLETQFGPNLRLWFLCHLFHKNPIWRDSTEYTHPFHAP